MKIDRKQQLLTEATALKDVAQARSDFVLRGFVLMTWRLQAIALLPSFNS